MTKVIARVHPVHLMNVDWAPGGHQPSDQASRLGLWVHRKLAATIHIHHRHCYYYSSHKLILILPSHGGWKAWVDLGTAVKVHSPCPRLYIAAAVVINTTIPVWLEPGSSHTAVRRTNPKLLRPEICLGFLKDMYALMKLHYTLYCHCWHSMQQGLWNGMVSVCLSVRPSVPAWANSSRLCCCWLAGRGWESDQLTAVGTQQDGAQQQTWAVSCWYPRHEHRHRLVYFALCNESSC